MRKILITESQLVAITKMIREDAINNKLLVKQVADYLTMYYDKSFGTYKDKAEYKNTPMVLNKVDNELVSPQGLLRHLKEKFKLSPQFLSQVIRDWYDNKYD